MASGGSRVTTLKGAVRSASGVALRSPLGDKPCVAWEVREALDDDQDARRGAQDFWLDTDDGPVLVRGDHVDLAARGERQVEMLAVVETDIEAVGDRLGKLKIELKNAAGQRASKLQRERKQLAHAITVLHTLRAHARGKLHRSGTRAQQAEWLRVNAARAEAGDAKSLQMAVERWEATVAEGQLVTATGRCEREPVDGLEGGDGYRSRGMALVIRGDAKQPVVIRGADVSTARAKAKETSPSPAATAKTASVPSDASSQTNSPPAPARPLAPRGDDVARVRRASLRRAKVQWRVAVGVVFVIWVIAVVVATR